jgi:hypothetical protein
MAKAAVVRDAPAPGVARRAAERARRALGSGGVLLLLGLAMVGVGEASTGGVVTLAGLVIVIYGIHTFGRLGPDDD